MDAGNVEENVVDVGENNLARMDHVLYSQNSNGRRIHTNACPIALHSLRFNSARTINNNRDERRNEVGDRDDQGAKMRVIVRFL